MQKPQQQPHCIHRLITCEIWWMNECHLLLCMQWLAKFCRFKRDRVKTRSCCSEHVHKNCEIWTFCSTQWAQLAIVERKSLQNWRKWNVNVQQKHTNRQWRRERRRRRQMFNNTHADYCFNVSHTHSFIACVLCLCVDPSQFRSVFRSDVCACVYAVRIFTHKYIFSSFPIVQS